MSKIVIYASELALALDVSPLDAEDIVIDLAAYTPADYSHDAELDDEELLETCGLCDDSVELIERLSGKTCFELTQREWDFYGRMADALEFAERRAPRIVA